MTVKLMLWQPSDTHVNDREQNIGSPTKITYLPHMVSCINVCAISHLSLIYVHLTTPCLITDLTGTNTTTSTCIYLFSAKAKQTQMSVCVFWSRAVYEVWHFSMENVLPLTCIFHVLLHSVCFFPLFALKLSLSYYVFKHSHLKACESERQTDRLLICPAGDALCIELAKYTEAVWHVLLLYLLFFQLVAVPDVSHHG